MSRRTDSFATLALAGATAFSLGLFLLDAVPAGAQQTPPQRCEGAACDFAINTKGTGTSSGRAQSGPGRDGDCDDACEHAINTKGTGVNSGRSSAPGQACGYAINTKGTGANSGRAQAPGRACEPVRPDGVSSQSFTVTGTFSDGTSRPITAAKYGSTVFEVSSAADFDGDGFADSGLLSVRCANGSVTDAAFRPRDAGSGMASGKRQHTPPLIRRSASGPQSAVGRTVTWDLKESKGRAATPSSSSGWKDVTLVGDQAGLCPKG